MSRFIVPGCDLVHKVATILFSKGRDFVHEASSILFFAKQCWQILHNPTSLWAQVLKARYFPHCSFLEAKRGGRASWLWSSLLVGRDLLLDEVHWQIMGGRDVRVWVDKWLPSLPMGHLVPRGRVLVSRTLRVDTLICPSTKSWDIDFLIGFLSQNEMAAIRDLQIEDLSKVDRLVWPYDKRGRFLVQSRYHWEFSRMHSPAGLPLSPGTFLYPRVWTFIWKLNTPPKIRHFLWKSLHGAFSTMANLFWQKSAYSSLCHICHIAEEMIEHLLLKCPWVEALWFGGALNFRVNRADVSSWRQ